MFELEINASKTYTVTVADDLSAFKQKVLPFLKGESVALITDEKVNALYGDALNGFLSGKRLLKIVVKSGERSKNARNYLKIINALAENGFTREDAVIAFGGGMIGDLAGFAASTYMRGITLVSVPTTLLSAVDSSVGGKTAIDLAAGKNLCGTFYQPSAVYIALSFLRTLPKREVQSGLGEVIKYAFLSDTVNAEDIKRADGELVFKCLKIKRDIVNADEKENGARALLNFGHTVGHAIEKLSGYRLSHGLCVAKGMACAVAVSQRIYGLSDQTVAKMRQLLEISKHDLTNTFSAADITDAIKADKKRKGDCVNFIVVKDIGKPQIVKIRFSVLAEIIKEYENKNKAI